MMVSRSASRMHLQVENIGSHKPQFLLDQGVHDGLLEFFGVGGFLPELISSIEASILLYALRNSSSSTWYDPTMATTLGCCEVSYPNHPIPTGKGDRDHQHDELQYPRVFRRAFANQPNHWTSAFVET